MSMYAVVDPATGETVKEYPTISDDDLRAAIGRADEAHRTWSASSTVAERAELVRRVGELHVERRQELAEIIVREMGKPIEQALGEVDFVGDIYGFYADNAEELMADEPIKLLAGDGSAVVRRSSLGVLLGIMPWNFPYYQVARFAGPNLVIGNTIVLKHAPQCPESAEAMQKLFDEAGFPEGAYENVYATNEQIEWVIADPRVRGVSVTGSERAGAAVAEIAGRNLKKVVLEMGGSDPFIVLGTDDLDKTVEDAVAARLDNTGQSCNAAKRFIVVDDLYEPFLEKFTAAMTAVEAGRPDIVGQRDRSAVVDRRGRPARGPGQACDRPGREGGRRRGARGQLLRADRPDRHRPRQRRLPRGAVRPGRAGLPRVLRGGGGQARERHALRAGLVRDDDRPRAGRARGRTRSTPAWST